MKDSGDLCSETMAAPCIIDDSIDDDDVEGEPRFAHAYSRVHPYHVLCHGKAFRTSRANEPPPTLLTSRGAPLVETCRAHVHRRRSRHPGQRRLLQFELRILRR